MVPVDGIPILVFSSTLLLIMTISSAVDTMNTTESIRDSEVMVSADGSFKLGFFSPGSSQNRYLGIWYNKISERTVVWVANREIPLTDSSGVLRVTHRGGVLVLLNHNGNCWDIAIYWQYPTTNCGLVEASLMPQLVA
jgi:hypothetical protein